MSGITNKLVGGKKIDSYNHGEAMSQDETDYMNSMKSDLNSNYHFQEKAYDENLDRSLSDKMNGAQDQYDQQLQDFLARDKSGNPTGDQLNQANQFVDQTFTNPSQVALDQYQQKFDAGQEARAAALGRNPNSDMATNQAIYGEGLRNQTALAAERGSRVAQTARGLNDLDYNRGISGLNAAMTGISSNQNSGSFLNSLNQQAFSNRFNLMNQRSQIADYFQRDRESNRTMGGGGTTSGIMTNATAIGGGLSNMTNAWNGTSQVNSAMSPLMGMSQMGSNVMGGGGGGGLMSMAALA